MGKYHSTLVKIPIPVIKEKVSIASRISIEEMELPNKWPGARKRERVNARNVSMALSKDLSGVSLSTVGMYHGGRDHATVLHAHLTVEELLSTKDFQITEIYNYSKILIDEWIDNKKPLLKRKLSKKEKTYFVKTWIKNSVPLYIRQQILDSVGKRCHECGNLKTFINGDKLKTLPNNLQRSYKKQV